MCAARLAVPKWVSWNSKLSGIPKHAIVGGKDVDGNDFYVIKAETEHGTLPGKYNKLSNHAYVPYGTKEIMVENFEVTREFL